jgi:D-3-phosphoglycerate dehydrogenase / 2-oxoglutarate reductase
VPVFVLDPISPRALARLGKDVVDWRDPALATWPDQAEAIITRTSPVGAADIARARRLRVIGKHGVGVDNIALDAARARGIPVVNTPGANADGVAELVLGMALAAARHLVAADRALRAGTLAQAALPGGHELAGRRLGIAGFGQVGRRVADLFARALRSPVTAYDPALPAEAIRAAGAAPAASIAALVAESDVLSLHLPLTAGTRGLIGARELALMPEGSILINTARGGIVDEAALAAALRIGRPAAAASDVFVTEPPPPDHPLLRLPNFIATPHIGGATDEALDRVGLLVVEQVLEVLAGKPPRHPVGG